MTRAIRVRKENLDLSIRLLREAGFEAFPCPTPTSNAYHYRSYPDQDYDWDRQREAADTLGMAGVETNASGNQAHKVFVKGGMIRG